ncbi:ATP-dependent nuclease [Nitrosomonas communis]|uniref:Predicted ATP-dependent endonuclease of the OLD family, contains P-loop ATPase and TOPRIM domains n=1 Tax=Nitrosomonas communis TaxID=44574 RepID=A0A1H2SPU5_9PROT|nr:AAA family ATPase [Nitrosomonas communis]SDW33620.1 Predicted ATP-dependent endonuclease of the OLD family, contains P-loop ATPase and TOPRIM domains [Nitrosomonas communis]
MAKIVRLEIKNFRGIEELSLKFKCDQNLICIIGRGDSGKTTILDAISSVLSPSWNISFYDTDFYKCDTSKRIEIQTTLIDFSERLLSDSKFGLYISAFNTQTNEIIDNVATDDLSITLIPALTIKLIVDEFLEPEWIVVTNRRTKEGISISGADRAFLNCFMVSDYIDRHFSWNKGNPLYALLKSTEQKTTDNEKNVIIQSLREAKKGIDINGFDNLYEATDLIKAQALELGLDISDCKTTLDFKELSIKDTRISLHEDLIPFRQKGKGSKRLASLAIQSALVRNGGIMLVDEIEQGLEPDRIKQVVRSLMQHHAGQIIITTHSREAISELGTKPLLFLLKDKETNEIQTRLFVHLTNDSLQKTVRACPEAFFAKKVIVCEGATEVGICRAMDKWRRQHNKPQMSFRDCAYVDGNGSTLITRFKEISLYMETALFCDSDDTTVNAEKSNHNKADIFDCEDGLCIEQQIFQDLPWDGVKELLQYAKKNKSASFDAAFPGYISNPINEWKDEENIRKEIISIFKPKNGSTGKDWFKTIHHGEFLGNVIFKNFTHMNVNAHLRVTLNNLSTWIDGGEV